MSVLLAAAAALPAAVVIAHGGWWSVLSTAALARPGPSRPPARPWRLAVVVPAHNEELLLGACLDSLLGAPYQPRPEIVVVADNCTDGTAAVAHARGVTVLERQSASERGKSYALDHALAYLRGRVSPPAAVIFVDADSVVSPETLAALAAALEGGALAAQAHYAPLPAAGELAALRRLALALAHWSRPLGAARLGLGSGLKGNGMALRWQLVAEGFGGSGITEDAALTLRLAGQGVAVRFVPGATVRGHMATGYRGAIIQDRRWEGGRLALLPAALVAALKAFMRGHPAAAAGALEVASLPLTLVGGMAVAALALAAAGATPAWLAATATASLGLSVVLELAAARVPPRDVLALRGAPRFVLHKLSVYGGLLRKRPGSWQRTARD